MNNLPMLSICVPTYNRAKQLERQLNYIITEIADMENVELIVANNASSDNTNEIINRILKKYPFKYVCNASNIGVVKNTKKLASNAIGKYIWFIGDDDELEQGLIKRVVKQLEEQENITGIYVNTSVDPVKLKKGEVLSAKERCIKLLPVIKGGYLFLTSNIVLLEAVQEIFELIPDDLEAIMSIYMIHQFVAALRKNGFFVVIPEPCIKNDNRNISWKKQYYKITVKYNTEIFFELSRFGYSTKEAKRIAKKYFVSENRRIFLEILKHFVKNPKEALFDYCWYMKKFPVTTTLLIITLPVRSIIYLCIKRGKNARKIN